MLYIQTSTQIEPQHYTSIHTGVALLAVAGGPLYQKFESSTSQITIERILCSPVSFRNCCVIVTSCPIFVLSTGVRVRIQEQKRTFLETTPTVPKYSLKAEAEAIDLIVPLVSTLMSMVLCKRLHLVQKMSEFRGTETQFLRIIRSPRSRQVQRYKHRGNPKDRDRDSCLASISGGPRGDINLYNARNHCSVLHQGRL
jgi:hypothetical protein